MVWCSWFLLFYFSLGLRGAFDRVVIELDSPRFFQIEWDPPVQKINVFLRQTKSSELSDFLVFPSLASRVDVRELDGNTTISFYLKSYATRALSFVRYSRDFPSWRLILHFFQEEGKLPSLVKAGDPISSQLFRPRLKLFRHFLSQTQGDGFLDHLPAEEKKNSLF